MTEATARTAIVTGGARGIGAAIAARLAADGLAVAVFDLDEAGAKSTAARIADHGHQAVGIAADVSDEAAVTAAVAQTASELGPPLVVVNNAGVTRDNLIFKMTGADWDTVMNVHPVAPGFIATEMTRATAERMGITFEEFTRRQLDKIPVGRAGQPDDIANLVAYLVSEGAGFVSGQVIYAAGGPRS
jgi:3-oxoacyl-[acyl-carrier protein] reductase